CRDGEPGRYRACRRNPCRGYRVGRPQYREQQESNDEPRHEPRQLEPRRGCTATGIFIRMSEGKENHYGTQHQNAYQFHERSYLAGEDAHRECRGENLRDRVNGESSQDAVLIVVEPEWMDQEWQSQYDDDTEDRRERDGRHDVFL